MPLQRKLRALADNIVHERERAISNEDIVHFVRKQVREINNPIFGVPIKNKLINQKLFSIIAQLKSKNNVFCVKSCFMCQEFHYLNQCQKCRDLVHKDRLKFVVKSFVFRAYDRA